MQTRTLPVAADVLAPDGSEVRILANTPRGSMAHFKLPPGACSKAIRHRTVDEVWFVVAGQGAIWRKTAQDESEAKLAPGVSLNIPVGTSFQFRAADGTALEIVGVTMPPWPGDQEAEFVAGKW